MKDKTKMITFLGFIKAILPRASSAWQISALVLLFAFFGGVKSAEAVLPPDFIFNVGSNITQILSLVVISLSGGLLALKNFINAGYVKIKHTKLVWIAGIIIVALITSFIIYGYVWYQSKKL